MREKQYFNFAKRWQESNPEAIRRKNLRKRSFWVMTGVIVVLVAVLAPLAGIQFIQYQLDNTNQQIDKLAPVNVLLQQSSQLKMQLNNQRNVLNLTQATFVDPQNLLNQLGRFFPQGAVLSSFSVKGDIVNMQLTIDTPLDVARLWTSLQDSGMFTNIDLQSVSLQDKSQSFTLNLKLTPQAYKIYKTDSSSQQNVNLPGSTASPNKPNLTFAGGA